jgi:NADH:ubiquinone oxidoreductase subunit 6 (subunit J)
MIANGSKQCTTRSYYSSNIMTAAKVNVGCRNWFLPFVVFFGNCMYIGFSNHQIYIFINFVSLLVLGVPLVLLVLRVLCLSLMLALVYSGAVIITFIFVVMTFDQSDILVVPSYKFIPAVVLYVEGFIP